MDSPYAQYAGAVFRTQRYSGSGLVEYSFGPYLFSIPGHEGMLNDIARRIGAARDGISADGVVRFRSRIPTPKIIEDALLAALPARK